MFVCVCGTFVKKRVACPVCPVVGRVPTVSRAEGVQIQYRLFIRSISKLRPQQRPLKTKKKKKKHLLHFFHFPFFSFKHLYKKKKHRSCLRMHGDVKI